MQAQSLLSDSMAFVYGSRSSASDCPQLNVNLTMRIYKNSVMEASNMQREERCAQRQEA